METLLKLLPNVATDTTIETREFLRLDHPVIAEISALAEWLLITHDGECNWNHIEKLALCGYTVFPVERDSFGWVIGGISTEKGVITYG